MKDIKISEIMTTDFIQSYPDMIMTDVSKIFEENSFHHLPVIDDSGVCVGVISKSDYYQLQDQFTRKKLEYAEKINQRFFKTLLASEVMTKDAISLNADESVGKAIGIFLENKVHSIIINENGTCAGIITPYDILKQIK